MSVLIDGNNLMFAAREIEDPDRPVGRLMLAQTLGEWAASNGRNVHIVYDGPEPQTANRRQFEHPHLTVTFSGSGVSADAVMADLMAETSAPRHLLVVSSDREVQRSARRRRSSTVASGNFWRQVKSELARPQVTPLEPEEKSTGLDEPAVDEWMRLFGLAPEDGAGQVPDNRKRP